MADPDLLEFIREYDIIFLTETMKGNDYTLVLPGYQVYHVSRSFKHKNASRASGGIGILVANKFEKHTGIYTLPMIIWYHLLLQNTIRKILKSAVPIYHQKTLPVLV